MNRRSCLCDSVVEAYLDTHPDFLQHYFSTRTILHSFLQSSTDSREVMSYQSDSCDQSAENKHRQVLKPMRESVSMMNRENILRVFAHGGHCERLESQVQYECLNEKELLMELIRDISNELDVERVSHKILVNVGILTKADRCSLFLAQGSKENRILVSKLFDVTPESSLEDSSRAIGDEITVAFGVGIAGHTAKTGETINIKNAYQDPRFNSAIDKQTGYKTHSIVCMPIKNYDGQLINVSLYDLVVHITVCRDEGLSLKKSALRICGLPQVIGVAQVINKKSGDHEFTEKDVEVVKNYLTFCGIGITNAQLFELSVMEYKRNQVLLQLAKRIFEEQTSLEKVVHNIMLESRELWHCERCSVFLVDTSVENDISFMKTFDLLPEEDKVVSFTGAHCSRNNGIAAFSATTGQTINISDVYEDTRFCDNVKQSDSVTGFRTKSILCTPIKREPKIIGVCQLINKIDGRPFDENDESLFEAFAIFCGIGIHNTTMYEQTCKLLAKQMVAMEVLSYHARASPEDVDRLMLVPVPDSIKFNLYDLAFSDFELTDDATVQASVRMFLDLNILELFHVPRKTLVSWLLSVKKNYRPVIYHNWRHAFNVAQTMFAMLTTGKMRHNFTDLEIFALLVACLCHDLDHRGTNNTFQSKIESPLARLYGTSTMEHHHFDHCIMILNSEGNNIFSELLPDDYRKTIAYLEHAILSTDLQIYFQKRSEFEEIVEGSQPPNWEKNNGNRTVLRAMMMTACDVSAITKPWPIQQAVAKLVASEFFQQGDIERDKLKSEPMPMMDRKKIDDLPKMQVGFIDAICTPIYELMQKVEPSLSPLYNGVISNRKNWESLSEQENSVLDLQTKNSINAINDQLTSQSEQSNNNSTMVASELASESSRKRKNSSKKMSSKTCCLV